MSNNSIIPKVILLLGVSGVGKSTVLDYLEKNFSFDTAPKYTTRKRRSGESEDKHFVFCDSVEEFPETVLSFFSYGDYFGIQLDKIEKSLSAGKNHVIIIGDSETAEKLKRIYGDSVIVILLYCKYDILRERFEMMESPDRRKRWDIVKKEISEIYRWLGVVDYILDCSNSFDVTVKKIDLIIRSFELNYPKN